MVQQTSMRRIEDEAAPQAGAARVSLGTQTLVRGLDILSIVAEGGCTLNDLSTALQLTRSTAHRLAATLVEHRYLDYARNQGYRLGPKLLELGFLASNQLSLPRSARPYLEDLAVQSGDTIHLAVRDGDRALYLDKIAGRRRVEIGSRVGERQPLRSTGLGKALILDESEGVWRGLYELEDRRGSSYGVDYPLWIQRMRDYASRGYAFDLEENEDRIRCVAAPIRGVAGVIVGAISISSAAQYMDDDRMHRLVEDVQASAGAISLDLGWSPRRNRFDDHISPPQETASARV